MTQPPRRRPTVFPLDDPGVTVSAPKAGAHPAFAEPVEPDAAAHVRIEVQPLPLPALPVEAPAPAQRRRGFGALAWSAAGGLFSMWLGLQIWQLVEELLTRSTLLGGIAIALAGVVAFALLVLIVREVRGLLRLNSMAEVRSLAEAAIAADDREGAAAVARRVLQFTAANPNLARARRTLSGHLDEIIDGRDLVHVTERELLAPLDLAARRMITDAAARVSVVTAVSPRALVDIAFVAINALHLVRGIAALYGGRPGALGLLRLGRAVISHLALTGGLAAGDSLLQQVVGHGLAAKVSAKLGEGLLNGMMTVRLGVAAVDAIRPLPFAALPRASVRELAADLIRRTRSEGATPDKD